MSRYSQKAQETIEDTMHEYKQGKLRSGKSGKKVTNKRQAVAIGISKAEDKGYKVPKQS